MNKRSATFIAATLVGVLAIGGAAFSLGLTGPTASAAAERTTTAAQRTIGRKPIVRTHTRTVIVHRQASATAPTIVEVSSSNSGPSASSGPSTSSGSSYEGNDDGVEGEDTQSQGDQGQDDHGGSDDD
jgi:hypothetical protein